MKNLYILILLLCFITSAAYAGTTSTNGYFYLPAKGATGTTERDTWVAAQEATDAVIKVNADHSADNTQAHTDYLKNDADDTTTASLYVLDGAFGSDWNGIECVPTKNAVYDQVITKLFNDQDDTTTASLYVLDGAFGSDWNGITCVPTKNAVYDQVVTKLFNDQDDTTTASLYVLDGAFGSDWNGLTCVPTKNAVYDQVITKLFNDQDDTTTGGLWVRDEGYDDGWNGSTEVPTKNAVYDEIEGLVAGSGLWTDRTGKITPNDAGDSIVMQTADGADSIVIYADAIGGIIDVKGTQLLIINDPAKFQDTITIEDGSDMVVTANADAGPWISSDSDDTSTAGIWVRDEGYDANWNGKLEVPTKNAVYDQVVTKLFNDQDDTTTGGLWVRDEGYDDGWNAKEEVPTKNAVYDKIETIKTSFSSGICLETPDAGDTFVFHKAKWAWTAAKITVTMGLEDDGTDTATVDIVNLSDEGNIIKLMDQITADGDSPQDDANTDSIADDSIIAIAVVSQSGDPTSVTVTVEGTED